MQETPRPENLLGERIVAALIDLLILAAFGMVMAALFGDFGSSGEDESFTVSLNGLPFVIYVVLSLGYYYALEMQSGQTLGKKVMNLRVTALDGNLTNQNVAIRTILRLVDGLPFFYLLGLLIAAVSSRRQRIGDLAAGTIIVRA